MWLGFRAGPSAGRPRRHRRVVAWALAGAAGCYLAAGLVAGCGGGGSQMTAPTPLPQLPLIATHALTITEPSDVTIDDSGTRLWMVGTARR
jgi:hypothetical protein